MAELEDFDPTPEKRTWYRHRDTADRGYAVRRGGKAAIRYDRPATDQISFDLNKWEKLDDDIPRFNAVTIGQIAFEADRKLCLAMGKHDRAKREWLDMTEKQRKTWCETGPLTEPNAALYKAIKAALVDVR